MTPGVACGVDIVSVARIRAAVERSGPRFLQKYWTEDELAYCAGRPERLAARWAAKEAVMKVLEGGFDRFDPLSIEVRRDVGGVPRLELAAAAADHAREVGLASWSLSLSHEQEHAIAMVTALRWPPSS
ncbi:holo-ACP synthase [Aeromicrobium sp. Marseille-Q0843]|uniref:Holo-[acyl-carrier-protein] synthase n=1 Tax=Aeromicrobium phoceense TaxID=2754045 RepID=A0A838XHB2_9ACTN|nr:holo-ACP synthase [Aeromicrobium phoceense]